MSSSLSLEPPPLRTSEGRPNASVQQSILKPGAKQYECSGLNGNSFANTKLFFTV